MRETYRLQKSSLQNDLEENGKYLAAFMIYTGNEIPSFDDIFEKMGSALFRLKKIIQDSNSDKTR